MYRQEKWVDGWLYIRGLPNGPWVKATPEEVIQAQRGRIATLELIIQEKEQEIDALHEGIGRACPV